VARLLLLARASLKAIKLKNAFPSLWMMDAVFGAGHWRASSNARQTYRIEQKTVMLLCVSDLGSSHILNCCPL